MRSPLRRPTILVAQALLMLLDLGSRPETEPEILFGADGCTACGMSIDSEKQASGYYLEREFHPFCSSGCLLADFENRRKTGQKLPQRIYVAGYSEGGLRPAAEMTFLLTDHLPTVMEWGILAFSDPGIARQHRQHDDELLTDWLGVRRLRGAPDRSVAVEFIADSMIPPR